MMLIDSNNFAEKTARI